MNKYLRNGWDYNPCWHKNSLKISQWVIISVHKRFVGHSILRITTNSILYSVSFQLNILWVYSPLWTTKVGVSTNPRHRSTLPTNTRMTAAKYKHVPSSVTWKQFVVYCYTECLKMALGPKILTYKSGPILYNICILTILGRMCCCVGLLMQCTKYARYAWKLPATWVYL